MTQVERETARTSTGTGFRLSWGVLGGLIAGVTIDGYLFAVGEASWPGLYQFIASALVGRVAFSGAGYAWLGVLLHCLISAAWGALYGLAAAWWPALLARPVGSGLAYGVVVLGGMQVVMRLVGIPTLMSPALLTLELIGHTVFFGLPLALTLRLAARSLRGAPGGTRRRRAFRRDA